MEEAEFAGKATKVCTGYAVVKHDESPTAAIRVCGKGAGYDTGLPCLVCKNAVDEYQLRLQKLDVGLMNIN